MKIRSIIALTAALSICASFAGCGADNASSSDAPASSTVVSETDGTSEESDAEELTSDDSEDSDDEDAPAEMGFAPSQEILDAAPDSGYVQICNDVFRNGGYLTVNDFISQYGDNWELPENFDDSEEMVKDCIFKEAINKSDKSLSIELACIAQSDEKKTLGDAVIVKFKPGNADKYTWFPGGYQVMDGNYSLDEIRSVYQKLGYTEEFPENYSEVVSEYEPTANVGKCFIEEVDSIENNYSNMESLLAVAEMADENLFGVKPVIAISYSMSDDVDYEQSLADLRDALDAAQNGEVIQDPGFATDSSKRSSSCSYSRIFYMDNKVMT